MTFEQALRGAGLHPREIVADGLVRRCTTDDKPGKRNGWYALHPDGRGVWGDWTTGGSDALGHWRDESVTAAAHDPKLDELKRLQRERDRERRLGAMRDARAFWARCKPLRRPHPYIANKGLQQLGCAGLREHGDLLVVPVWHGDWLVSVQTISPAGEKRFWTGAPVKGGCYPIERPNAAVTALVEGLATGLAIYQSVRHARVIVCFDAGNLLPVVERMRPTGSVVFCADNDAGTLARRGFNPGLDKARNAAELIGAGVAWPEGIEGTDYADMLKELGEGAGRRIERAVMAKVRYVPAVAA